MSKTLENIEIYKKGYISENYGQDMNIFPLNYVLEKEMLELGNIDIPLYLSEKSLINLDKFQLTNEIFMKKTKLRIQWMVKS